MPKQEVVRRARQARREGKAPSTQASAFVRENMHELGRSQGPKSRKQAIAIGLDEARRAGVPLPTNREGRESRGGSQQAAQTGPQADKPRSAGRARPARTGQKRTAHKRKSARGETSPTGSTARRAPAKAGGRASGAPSKRRAVKGTSSASPTRSGPARSTAGTKSRGASKRTRARIEG